MATRLSMRVLRHATLRHRLFHSSRICEATTPMLMPAMSPTMTEGSISEWKLKEGDSFSAGDVLLSIETDKASIDVEAQDDGIMGKILAGNNTQAVQVGKLIALLAEEGDDLSAIKVPDEAELASTSSESTKEASEPTKEQAEPKRQSSAPATSTDSPTVAHALPHPKSDKPLLPSVMRMLVLNRIKDANKIKGTGYKGTLTKGDVLAFLGKVKSPLGTDKAEDAHPAAASSSKAAPAKAQPPLDGPALRRLIATGLANVSKPVVHDIPSASLTFDDVLNDYLSPSQRKTAAPIPTHSSTQSSTSQYSQFFS